jgi:hypothetical protein
LNLRSPFELFVSAFKNPFPGNGDCGSKRPGSTKRPNSSDVKKNSICFCDGGQKQKPAWAKWCCFLASPAAHIPTDTAQAASLHTLVLPMLLPGITVSTSAHDFAPIKQMQLQKFDGTTWKLFGEVISGSGS